MAGTTRRFAVSGDRWIELGPMTGRDFLTSREMLSRAGSTTEADVAAIVGIITDRVTASSEGLDPIDLPLDEIIEIYFRWYMDTDDAAVPTPTGNS